MKKLILILTVVVTGFLTSCNVVSVKKVGEFPAKKFENAMKHIEGLKNDNSKPQKLSLLIYDGQGKELVQMNIPLWLADFGISFSNDKITEIEVEGTDCDFEELFKNLPCGLLAQVEDYEENSHILIWIE